MRHAALLPERLLPLLVLLLPACAPDNGLAAKDDAVGFDSGADLDSAGQGGGDTVDGEACDGVDNDGDGEVDEGFGDVDADGIADCLDQTCTLALPGAGTIGLDAACDGDLVSVDDPWNVALAWEWRGLSTDPTWSQIFTMPVVGHLTDDDGDGDIDEQDVPTIVVPVYSSADTFGPAMLVALSGVDGHEVWTWSGAHLLSGATPLVADLDGDGLSEVVVFTDDYRVVALTHDGHQLWASVPLSTQPTLAKTAIVADLEGDGTPDIVADNAVLDAASGVVEAYLDNPLDGHRAPVAADLDRDGVDEILLAGSAFSPDGTKLWTIDRLGGCGYFAAVADLDGDPSTGEVVWALNERVTAYRHDGTELWDDTLPDANPPGPPVIADLDGDGRPDIGVEGQGTFAAFDADGALSWQAPVNGLYNAAAAFDFDGDGAYEPVIADLDQLYIFDGRTGAVDWTVPDSGALTYWGSAVIADVDGDGAAEIVLGSNGQVGGWAGVRVWEHAGAGWAHTGSTWGGHDYAVTNLPDDGSVPMRPTPSYAADNLFRARPGSGAGVDLVASVIDACAASCSGDGLVEVSVQVANRGAEDVPAGTSVAVYSVGADGGRTFVGAVSAPAIPSGTSSAAISLSLPATAFGPFGIVVVADDDGAGRSVLNECDEANNEGDWAELLCP